MFGGNPFYRSGPFAGNSGGYHPSGPAPPHNPYYPYAYPEQQRHALQQAQYERELERQRLDRLERARQYVPEEYDVDPNPYAADYDGYPYGYPGREQTRPRTASQQHHSIPIQTPAPPNRMPEPQVYHPSQHLHPEHAAPSTAPQSTRKSPSPSRASPDPPRTQSTSSHNSPSPAPAPVDSHTKHVQDAIAAIADIENAFVKLRREFIWPSRVDFECDGQSISLPVDGSEQNPRALSTPKLAFTTTNKPIHAYNEMLNRLLVKLDAVDSWGERMVRERRRGVVSTIEAEASRLERSWKQVWAGKSIDDSDEEEVETILSPQAEEAPL